MATHAGLHRYSIREHRDDHADYGDPNSGNLIGVYCTAADSGSDLDRLAAEWESIGCTTRRAGQTLYVTAYAHGEKLTYRTWQV